MKHIIWFIFIFIIKIQLVNGGCPRATFAFIYNDRNNSYNFIDSSVGNIGSLETCPYTGRPYVYLPCYPNSTWGKEPYFSNCLKPFKDEISPTILTTTESLPTKPHLNMSIDEISNLVLNTSNDISYTLSYLNQETIDLNSSAAINSAVNIINQITINNRNTTDEINTNFYSFANKILSSKSLKQTHEQNNIVKLLTTLETYSQNLILNNKPDQTFVQSNLIVSIVDMPNNRTNPIVGFAYDSTKNETLPIGLTDAKLNTTMITLDPQAIEKQNRLTFSIYNHRDDLFDEKQYRLISHVLSLTVDQQNLTKDLGDFVRINFFIENKINNDFNGNLTCAYWHIYDNMSAKWSTDGCYLIDIKDRNIMCQCNHLTHFAILMDIEQKSSPKIIEQMLSLITIIGLILSSTGLCLTILTFIAFKKLRRHFSQKSLLLLSINLLFVNILFAIIGFNKLPYLPCTIIASLLHYFILSSFSWMFIMALIQYLLFVKVFPRSISSFTKKAAAFAQSVPLIPIIIILGIDPLTYTKRTDNICWLSNLPFYLSFILPIIIYITVNSVLFSIVARSLLCGKAGQQLRSTQMAESQRLSRFIVALSCFTVLGLTWIFGLFSIGPVRSLFQILFCVFSTLTGFFIFILYILTSKAKRACWTNKFKSVGIQSIYSTDRLAQSAFTSSKDFSTSSTNDQQRVPSRLTQFPTKTQHFIDAYMPSSPPPPAPPVTLPTPFLIEGDDPLTTTTTTTSTILANDFYEPRHVWVPQSNCIYEANQPTTSLDDYSVFYASNHDATKL